jgi:hypothetical protein
MRPDQALVSSTSIAPGPALLQKKKKKMQKPRHPTKKPRCATEDASFAGKKIQHPTSNAGAHDRSPCEETKPSHSLCPNL